MPPNPIRSRPSLHRRPSHKGTTILYGLPSHSPPGTGSPSSATLPSPHTGSPAGHILENCTEQPCRGISWSLRPTPARLYRFLRRQSLTCSPRSAPVCLVPTRGGILAPSSSLLAQSMGLVSGAASPDFSASSSFLRQFRDSRTAGVTAGCPARRPNS